MQSLPEHLKKYIVEQDYDKYTPVDQACWRFILRQLKNFLAQNAHDSYLKGLEKTGLSSEEIPKISEVSKKLEKFGWRALPVSGFIPPAAFMELQSLCILPIASDMRTIEHLMYTPAPDIVHEAAGHAPMLAHPEFAAYLRQYAEVAKKAIISREDLDVYEAIRNLSDIKENPLSKPQEIENAQNHLNAVNKAVTHVSEASELSRMNWWTAEYGLIGSLENPKIYGAGLLSSVGESRWCLSSKVKKIPISVDCIKTSYDITEPQPQLFVTPDFKTLSHVLEKMAEGMAFKTGGLSGLNKAINAQSVNTVQYNSGLQVSGILNEVICDEKQQPAYLRFSGASQLCYQDKELPGHGVSYHSSGFGSPVGAFKNAPIQDPSSLSESELENLGLKVGIKCKFEMNSGVQIEGVLNSQLRRDNKLLVLSFTECTVKYTVRFKEKVLFEPSWGTYDMAIGNHVTSVFGGPADRKSFFVKDDFVAARVPKRSFSEKELQLHSIYTKLRSLRKKSLAGLTTEINEILKIQKQDFPNEWLILIEALELTKAANEIALKNKIKEELLKIAKNNSQIQPVIEDGIQLSSQISI
jgi:phenylalanine-4-hydroxylase